MWRVSHLQLLSGNNFVPYQEEGIPIWRHLERVNISGKYRLKASCLPKIEYFYLLLLKSKWLLSYLLSFDKWGIFCFCLLPQKKCWNPNGAVCLIVVVTYDENISKLDMKSRNDLEWNLKVLILECNIWSVARVKGRLSGRPFKQYII